MEAETITVERRRRGRSTRRRRSVRCSSSKKAACAFGSRQGERQRERAFLRKGDHVRRNLDRQKSAAPRHRRGVDPMPFDQDQRNDLRQALRQIPRIQSKIEERIAGYDYKKTARLPLDFARRFCPPTPSRPSRSARANSMSAKQPRNSDRLPPKTATSSKQQACSAASSTSNKSTRWIAAPPVWRWSAATLVERVSHHAHSPGRSHLNRRNKFARSVSGRRSARSGRALGQSIEEQPAGKCRCPAIIHWENYHWVVLFDVNDNARLDRRSGDQHSQDHPQGTR